MDLTEAAKTQIANSQTGSRSAYDEAIKKIQEYYSGATQEQTDSFLSYFQELQEGAKNLGIDFASLDLFKDWDADQRFLTETADGALATDLAWFEKFKVLQEDAYNQMLQELAATSVGSSISGGGGGGGYSGRSSGGGGSSSSSDDGTLGTQDYKETATEQTDFYYREFMEAMNLLPDAEYAVMERYTNLANTGGPGAAVKLMQEDYDAGVAATQALEMYPEYSEEVWGDINTYIAATTAADNLPTLDAAIDFGQQYHPHYGPVITKSRVVQQGTWNQNNVEDVPNPSETPEVRAQVGANVLGNLIQDYANPVNHQENQLAQAAQAKIHPLNRPLGMTTGDEDYPLNVSTILNRQQSNVYGGVPLSQGALLNTPQIGPSLDPAQASQISQNNAGTIVPTPVGPRPYNPNFGVPEIEDNTSKLFDKLNKAQEQHRLQQAQAKANQARVDAARTKVRPTGNSNAADKRALGPATRANPAPQAKGIYGQTVQSTPYHIAAPTPKKTPKTNPNQRFR